MVKHCDKMKDADALWYLHLWRKKGCGDMQIIKLKDARFGSNRIYTVVSGYAFFEEGKGYIAFSSDRDKYGILTPYIPLGGRKALQSILDAGGFSSFEGMEYVNELQLQN